MWKIGIIDVTENLSPDYAEEAGIQQVLEAVAYDDSVMVHLCSMQGSLRVFPIAVCLRLDRPLGSLTEPQEDELRDFGMEWVNDPEANPYFSTLSIQESTAVPARIADDLPNEPGCEERDVRCCFQNDGCMDHRSAVELGIDGDNDLVICI